MILHGNQRAGAANLATHLMNDRDNDHVQVHEIRGCVSETLPGALQEMDAISRGTRCKQFMFSVSLNPPKDKDVSTDAFTDAADRVERGVGLEGQPRVIVLHEKNGRRHAHCIWSRIKTDEMKAINLPFYKTRLAEVAKELYLDHGWDLPAGLVNRQNRNPLNFTLQEWQQANRLGDDPRRIKLTLRECWSISDSKQAFASALEQQGYYLASGDRRGYVAVDWRGEVYSLSRWLGEKNKALNARLGEPTQLVSVDETKARIDQALVQRFRQHEAALKKKHEQERRVLIELKKTMVEKQRSERETLRQHQEARWTAETKERSARLRQGWKGLWDKVTGQAGRTRERNGLEAFNALKRDRAQQDQLIWSHIKARAAVDQQRHAQRIDGITQIQRLAAMLPEHTQRSLVNAPKPSGPSLS
jgi:hypothetical protein